MRNHTTVFVGLDVHKESIVAAYAMGSGEIQDLGNIGPLQRDLDRLCTRMRSKSSARLFSRLLVWKAGNLGHKAVLDYHQALELHVPKGKTRTRRREPCSKSSKNLR